MWLLMQYNVYSIEKIQRLYNDARGQCSNAKQKTCRIPHSNKYLVPQEKLRWLKNDQKRVNNWHSTKNEMVTNNHMNNDNNNKNSNSWLWIYENHTKKSYMWTEDKEGEYGSDLRRKGESKCGTTRKNTQRYFTPKRIINDLLSKYCFIFYALLIRWEKQSTQRSGLWQVLRLHMRFENDSKLNFYFRSLFSNRTHLKVL